MNPTTPAALNKSTASILLAEWRRTVADMYADVRRASPSQRPAACQAFRAARDRLFRSHPQSPLESDQRVRFRALPYYPYEPNWRVIATVDTNVQRESHQVHLATDGDFSFTRVARLEFAVRDAAGALSLFWIEGYGGGLFLPFRDASNGRGTYGGGRYLYDTIKGADLGACPDYVVLDFNYAYNPSCAYSPQWVCPLAPAENRLPFAVEAGEQDFAH